MSDLLNTVTRNAFAAYNAGGPPERAGLTHDGKPVPAFDALGPSVRHKWESAASAAALAGAEHALKLFEAHGIDLAPLRARITAELQAAAWWSGGAR
jgi:hypothetical protein